MTCPHCGQPVEAPLVPNRLTREPEELARCYGCARERVIFQDGTVHWMLNGKHCRKCSGFLWRSTTHGRYGHVVYLWPDPTHVIALHFVFGAGPAMQPYCQGCAPAMGEDPPHQAEAGGEPITLGPVVGYVDPAIRYARDYAPPYRRFIAAWLRDECAKEGEEIDALLAQWDADVAGMKSSPLRSEAGAGEPTG